MVEKGLAIAILPKLLLQRIAYDVMVKPLDVDAYRTIGVAMKNKKELSLAARRFLEYLTFDEYLKIKNIVLPVSFCRKTGIIKIIDKNYPAGVQNMTTKCYEYDYQYRC